LHGWEFHRWYVQVKADRLIFEEKPRALHDPELHEWFANWFEKDRAFENFFLDNIERLDLVSMYDWEGEIKYTVHRHPHSIWKRTAAKLETVEPITRDELVTQLKNVPRASLSRNERLKKRLSRIARRSSDDRAAARLRAMLCCPECKGELIDGTEGLACPACHASFPVVDNVYCLLPEQVPRHQLQLSVGH
jgi:uncharacterized protein YbaR (Trm112 family)